MVLSAIASFFLSEELVEEALPPEHFCDESGSSPLTLRKARCYTLFLIWVIVFKGFLD